MDAVRKLAESLKPFMSKNGGDWFVMHVIPEHSQAKPLPNFIRLRFELGETNVSVGALQEALGCRRSLTLEVFAREGTISHSSSGLESDQMNAGTNVARTILT